MVKENRENDEGDDELLFLERFVNYYFSIYSINYFFNNQILGNDYPCSSY